MDEAIEKIEKTNLQLMQENFDISNEMTLLKSQVKNMSEDMIKLIERILILEGKCREK